MENEAKSCSMDFGYIIHEYIHRMWGKQVSMEEIKAALVEIKNENL